ncbi:EF-hand domain-containing protein [Parvibium lacunae]|uniref:EF-hand domain-containing protein n=2 Tax=Parvibium lacunae TaxID=1888893 RepID=A0A368L5M6_9BURK|nr:EF-hand domain-containing protein [Parvibium lacunae]
MEKMRARLKEADKDGDGAISLSEATALPHLQQHFAALDTNQDGKVTREEMRAHHEKMRQARRSGGPRHEGAGPQGQARPMPPAPAAG